MDIKKILEDHKEYLRTGDISMKADLRHANLRNADLRNADLRHANLRNADLRYANLRYANLRYADLRYADLRYADLRGANLRYADLRYANLRYADLRYADLRYADLRYADLRGANLRYADLIYFIFNRDTAYYQFDGMIRIGCEYHPVDYWVQFANKIGTEHGYSKLEIEVYQNFINTCFMLEAEREDK